MIELVSAITLSILTLAAIVFLLQLMRQKKVGGVSASSFSTVLLLMLIGWAATEVVADLTGPLLGQAGRIAHFLVMILFAATMTFQLRRSSMS